MNVGEELVQHLADLRKDQIDHLYCGHCGGINNVRAINLEPEERHLCRPCRVKILEWI